MFDLEWNHGTDESHKSLMHLVNTNNGLWKSEKQGAFFLKHRSFLRDKQNLSQCFGIEILVDDALIVETSAYIHHAQGARGMVPYVHFFMVDTLGVVAVYRIRYKGNMRDGCGPDKNRVEIKWRREEAK